MRFTILALLASAAILAGATASRPAPDLTFQTSKGPDRLSNYKGKVIALEILSTTCARCQATSKILSKLNTELGDKGFQPIGVAINEGADVAQFIRRFNVNYPVGMGSRDKAFEFLQHSLMTPFYYPNLVFIDAGGNIRAQYGGMDVFLSGNEEANIRSMVEKLLSEASGKKPAASTKTRKKAS